MSAFIYSNGQYHALAGNKIVKNGVAITMKNNDQIVANQVAYPLGFSSGGTPETPVSPDAPECAIAHQNGTEPTAGTVRYITPNGAGSMDGSSWANAASMSMIHVILLSSASGDRVYFSEGDYTTDRTITLPSGVSLFGGFTLENPSWATRDAFAHPTSWTSSHSGVWLESASSIVGQLVDGFMFFNYKYTASNAVNLRLKNGFISGGTFAWSGTVSNSKIIDVTFSSGSVAGCWISGKTTNATSATDCVVIDVTSTIANAVRCDFYYGNTTVSTTADTVNVYGTETKKVVIHLVNATNCKAIYCVASNSGIFIGTAVNCAAINCINDKDPIFNCSNYSATNCVAVNCSSGDAVFYCSFGTATNCTAVNCISGTNITTSSGIFIGTASNCKAINCTAINTNNGTSTSYIFGGAATNCKAINCSSTIDNYSSYSGQYSCIFGSVVINCTAINCRTFCNTMYASASGYIFRNNGNAINCTAVNCISNANFAGTYGNSNAKNCLAWNNTRTDFANYSNCTTCAGSTHNAVLALTLGTDNSIARFTNTGYAPAQGVQNVGDCPNPITAPDGYAAWVESFGDWHPAANSFLLGKGTYDSTVTTDLDGTTRPNPPAIGAYELVPTP